MNRRMIVPLAAAFMAALSGTAQAALSDNDPNKDLIFVPVAQCRIIDTRSSGGGNLVAGVAQNFLAYGTVASQGGNPAGCPQPKADGGPQPVAMSANITAVGANASGDGNVKAYAAGVSSASALSLVNYRQGVNIANAATIPLCSGGSCPGGNQLSLLSGISNVPAVVDVLGYFYPRNTNVVWVATNGGDFTSPVDAMAYLRQVSPAPSAANPWVMEIGPGVYDLGASPLAIDIPHVTLHGAGQAATTLSGAGLQVTTGNVYVSGLKIAATGTGASASAIEADFTGNTLNLSDLAVSISGATANTGLVLAGSANVYAIRCGFSATGGTTATAVAATETAVLSLNENSTADASGATNNVAIRIDDASSVTVDNSSAAAEDGNAFGIRYLSSADASVTSSSVRGDDTGVSSAGTGTLQIDQSSITGLSGGLSVTSGTVQVGLSAISGAVVGTVTCVDAYDGSYAALDTSCQP